MHRYAISFGTDEMLSPAWQEAARHAKLHRIEASFGNGIGANVTRESVDNLLRLADEGAIEVASIHIPFAPFDEWRLSDVDEFKRSNGVKNILSFVESFKRLGAKNYTLHGSVEPNPDELRPAMMRSLKRSLEELLPTFQELGASINLENLPRTCLGRTPDELEEALDGFPAENLGICFDINHFCGTPERIPEYICQLAPRIRSFHISDYDGVDECHWYPGMGIIDWAAAMREINALKQDALIIFECSSFITPPPHTPRSNPIALETLRFRNGANNAFYLENAEELCRRQTEFQPL